MGEGITCELQDQQGLEHAPETGISVPPVVVCLT